MIAKRIESVLERLYLAETPQRVDIETLLETTDPSEIERLCLFADRVRKRHLGDAIPVRAIVEFSNYCRGRCAYCGLAADNTQLDRYRLTTEQILEAAEQAATAGIETIVLQSGEDPQIDGPWLADIIEQIKSRFDTAVTLSVGEQSLLDYTLWRHRGADRYLLKMETCQPELYEQLHPDMSFVNRLNCLTHVQRLGYQTGSGLIIGLKGQTTRMLADDMLFLTDRKLDMISISPFIPHPQTPLGDEERGDLALTLKALAVARILNPEAHMPAATSLAALDGTDRRPAALCAGANVVMIKCTPCEVRGLYDIYPRRKAAHRDTAATLKQLQKTASVLGRQLDYSRGDSIRAMRQGASPRSRQPRFQENTHTHRHAKMAKENVHG